MTRSRTLLHAARREILRVLPDDRTSAHSLGISTALGVAELERQDGSLELGE